MPDCQAISSFTLCQAPPGSGSSNAALAGVRAGCGVPAALADVARRAGVSRQAIYLHFSGRADLLTAVAQHADERRGLAAGVRRIVEAPSGADAVREMVALQARLNPEVWPLAVALDGARRQDAAAERAWQDRLATGAATAAPLSRGSKRRDRRGWVSTRTRRGTCCGR